jgi:tRNA A37 threonylcarbamoyladenosine synthetase subunit TsaC/SUA5/YrdC
MAKYITSLDNAKDIIQSSNLIAFPTETVYGLGGNALDHL